MQLFKKAKKRLLGLDIGSSAVKFVDLKETSKGYELENCGTRPLPPETIVDGSVMDTTTVVEAIRDLVSQYRIKKRDVAISVSGHSVIVKKISLPQMTGRYDDQLLHFAAMIRGKERNPWSAAHELNVQEALIQASGRL